MFKTNSHTWAFKPQRAAELGTVKCCCSLFPYSHTKTISARCPCVEDPLPPGFQSAGKGLVGAGGPRVTHREAAQHLPVAGPQCSSPILPLCPITRHPSGRAVGDRGIERNRVLRTKGKRKIKMQSSSSPAELFCLFLESRHKGLILRISSFCPFHLCITGSPVKPSEPPRSSFHPPLSVRPNHASDTRLQEYVITAGGGEPQRGLEPIHELSSRPFLIHVILHLPSA